MHSTYKCLCCGNDFQARVADRKRGWARYCSKRCKAIKQEQNTGQYSEYVDCRGDVDAYHAEDGSWDAHKGYF